MSDFLSSVGVSAKSAFPYNGSEIANAVLAKRTYLDRDENGNITETPEDMFWRVATTVAQVEANYGAHEGEVAGIATRFFEMMTNKRFQPNSPTLMNAGRPLGQLSACYVLPVEDAISNGKDGIYDSLRNMALIHQSGGGTGFGFSRLRAGGSHVRSTAGVASGPVSFMGLFDFSTEVVKQGGTRRGANMGILRVDHPDILEFINSKQDLSKNTNFNISIAITDEFMRALEEGTDYLLIDHKGKHVGWQSAREVWDTLIRNAHATGEPGLFFIDEANRHNPVPHLGDYEATNPCGEQPLLPYDVCNLGSLNVGAYVVREEDGGTWFDADAYAEDIHYAVLFLDNVIDANKYPLPEVDDLAKRIRRIGLGIMGFADALVRLGIPYGSKRSLLFADRIMWLLKEHSHNASEILAEKKGSFPEWESSVWGPNGKNRPMRNCNVTTVAPTGTISMIAGCSSGIEPLFAVAFYRNQAGMRMVDYNEDYRAALLREYSGVEGVLRPELLVQETLEETAALGSIPEHVPEHVRRVFTVAGDVSPEQHVAMQSAFQAHCDSAISKTINLPSTATVQDVERAYLQAYKSKLKGITVYRDGSRGDAPLTTGATGAPKGETTVQDEPPAHQIVTEEAAVCPECGDNVIHAGGCEECHGCGWTACKIG